MRLPRHILQRGTAAAICCRCHRCFLLPLLQRTAPAAAFTAGNTLRRLLLLLLGRRLLPHAIQECPCCWAQGRVAWPPVVAAATTIAAATATAAAGCSLRRQCLCCAGAEVARPVGRLSHVWHAKPPADLHAAFTTRVVACGGRADECRGS